MASDIVERSKASA